MARTTGSYSLGSVSWKELVRQIEGDEAAERVVYKGFIDISRKWLDNFATPQCEFVILPASQIQNPFVVKPNANGEAPKPLEMERAVPPQEVLAQSKPQRFSWNPDDD